MANQLKELEAKMAILVNIRGDIIAKLQRDIADTNAWFDEQAKPLAREIASLRKTQQVEHSTTSRRLPPPICVEDGFTEAEVEHYNQLLRETK